MDIEEKLKAILQFCKEYLGSDSDKDDGDWFLNDVFLISINFDFIENKLNCHTLSVWLIKSFLLYILCDFCGY